MSYLKRAIELLLLAAGVLASVATSWEDPPPSSSIRYDETWVVENLFDGQTAVPVDHEITLTIGYRDFLEFEGDEVDKAVRRDATEAFERIALYRLGQAAAPLPLEIQIYDHFSVIDHAPLAEETRYVLDLTALDDYLVVERLIPEPIHFSTTHGPQVTGVWRVDDTLILSFSEPMDPETLWLSQLSVDLIWEEDDELHSIAADLNLADFVWETDDYLFLFAPADFFGTVWVKVAGDVQGLSGAFLDGNGNGLPGEPDDDYLQEVHVPDLPVCYGRDDIPAPCVDEDDVEYWNNPWGGGW